MLENSTALGGYPQPSGVAGNSRENGPRKTAPLPRNAQRRKTQERSRG